MSERNEMKFAACVGLDWADAAHVVRIRYAGSEEIEQQEVKHTPEALLAWVSELRQRVGGGQVAIALEQSRGGLIHALMDYDFLVLFPVNPQTVAQYRKAFGLSGAKDDPDDAGLLLELVTLHRDKLRAWLPDDEQTRTLKILVECRRELVDERTRLTNRLTGWLKSYYPQALRWVGELTGTLVCEFLTRWPTLAAVQRPPLSEVRKCYQEHRCKAEVIERWLLEIEAGQPLTRDLAVVTAGVSMVHAIVPQLRALNEAVAKMDKQIAELFKSHPDYELFDSLPGAGKALAPRLLTALGADRSRYTTAQEVQQHSGIAPVTERSGKKCFIHWRFACPKFVRQSFQEFAAQSIRYSPWAKAFYDRQRQKGKAHHAAVRSLAYRWIRIIFRCWQERKPYSETVYQAALRRRQSPLASVLPATSQS